MKKIFLVFVFVLCGLLFSFSPVVPVYAASEDINIAAKAAFLMDSRTGKVLYEQNSDEKYPVASIVKLMTILLTLENIENNNLDLDAKVTASETASSMGGSQVFIEAGGEYSIEDLLKSVIVSSANDASVLLAETISGSENGFVKLMNKRAEELGLENTNYVNSTGLPIANQFSSAKDCAMLLREVSKHDLYHRYSKIWIDKLSHPKGRETELVNTNKLIRYYKGCEGGKTGSTDEAGYCLSAVASRGDMKLIAVVLGTESSKDRFAETTKLLNYGFGTFENKKIITKSQELSEKLKISNGKQKDISIQYKEDFYYTCAKNEKANITTKVELNTNLKAPISKGEKVGKVLIIVDNIVVGEIEIISAESVDKTTVFDNIVRILDNYYI